MLLQKKTLFLMSIASLVLTLVLIAVPNSVYWLLVLSLVVLVGELLILMPSQVLYFSLAFKPLIDISWRWRFLTIADQGINFQTIIVLIVVFTTFVLLLKKRVVFDIRAFFLIALAAFSVLITPTTQGFNELIRLYASVSFWFVSAVFLSGEKSFNRFIVYYVMSVSVPIFLSFLQLMAILPFEYWDMIGGERVGRISGSYQHPLNIIYFLIYAIPFSLYLLSYLRLSWKACLVLYVFIALSLFVVVLTYHRVGIVVIGLEIWLWMILTKRYGRAALLAAFGGLIAVLFSDRILVLYDNVFAILRGDVNFFGDDFLRGRGMNWYLFLNSLFSSAPWFWFFGLGGSIAEGWVPKSGYWFSEEPHNDFIRILHAYGLLGLTIYLSVLFTFFQKAWSIRKSNSLFNQGLGNIMIVVLVSIVLLSITTEPTRYPSAVWYLFALGSVIQTRYHEERKDVVM